MIGTMIVLIRRIKMLLRGSRWTDRSGNSHPAANPRIIPIKTRVVCEVVFFTCSRFFSFARKDLKS